jgi:hypothetical protein
MTYQEKYEELFKAYDHATKTLNEATQKIAFTNGFGDTGDLGNYFKANREYRFAEREFQKLLQYVTTANLNPASEYVPQEYMYNVIKKDQQKRGTPWDDGDLAPDTKKGVRGYECLIGLTNDGEINRMIQGTEYKFPVLNLHHGMECYNFLAKMLQYGGGEGFDANNLKFAHINEGSQIFIKVVITIWL